jgi:hypothetical protein
MRCIMRYNHSLYQKDIFKFIYYFIILFFNKVYIFKYILLLVPCIHYESAIMLLFKLIFYLN